VYFLSGSIQNSVRHYEQLIKGKVPVTCHEGTEGEHKYSSTHEWIGAGGQHHPSSALVPGCSSGAHCTEGWVGPWVGLDGYGREKRLIY
jgi:hypothetical protein